MNVALGWVWEDSPITDGWYAITYCWDAQEGMIPGADEWDGKKWGDKLPVIGYAGPFPNKEAAEIWAHEHDVDA